MQRVTSRSISCLLCAVLCAACARNDVYEPRAPGLADGSTRVADAGADAGLVPGPDAGTPGLDAGLCEAPVHWVLSSRRIVSASLLDSLNPTMGTATRLSVVVQLETLCDEVYDVTVTVFPGDATDSIELAAFVRFPDGASCAPTTKVSEAQAIIPGSQSGNPSVVVFDSPGPGSTPLLRFDRVECLGRRCDCHPGSPVGTGGRHASCKTDCDCKPSMYCIGLGTNLSPSYQCEYPCLTGVDCAGLGLSCGNLDGVSGLCIDPGPCDGVADACPRGFECVGAGDVSRCKDTRFFAAIECRCDAECQGGSQCWYLGPADYCVIPCLSELDCPVNAKCYSGAYGPANCGAR